MKKLLAFTVFLFFFILPVQSVFAADSSETGMSSSLIVSHVQVPDRPQLKISWNPIPHVQNYRICVDLNCSGPDHTKIWTQLDSSQTSYVFDQPYGSTRTYWVHALLWPSATNWTHTDDRPNQIGVKWDNPSSFSFTMPSALTTNTTISTEQENEDYEASCANRTWTANGNCVIVKKQTKQSINTTFIKTIPKTIVQKPLLTINPRLPDSASWNTNSQNTVLTVPKQEKEQTLMFGLKVSEFIVIMSILMMAFLYLLVQQMLSFKMKSKRFELEKQDKEYDRQAREYELRELAKAKINNEHEQTLKKLDHDVVIDRLDYTERQLKDERDFNLEQQKVQSISTDKVLSYIMPFAQNRDAHELKMAEIKASSSNSILDADDVTEAKVKFKK